MSGMEQVYKELEEMRSAMEAVTEQCRAKSLLSESLRRAHDEQAARLQEARAEVEKQAREFDAKDEEISVAKQMYEDLGSKFSEKESAFNCLSLAHENLRACFAEKVTKLEGDNKQLVSALDEANSKLEEQDGVICSCKREIERLKGLLSLSQKKCVDAELKAQNSKEGRRDEMIAQLERDKGEVEEKLKWKSEQFRHLEEAHEKTQEKFRAFKKEWEMERANLVDEISSLHTSLDSQTRVAEDLRLQLQMCNRALAHEESRRKLLEIQMNESKALYENVMSEYEEARLNIRSLTEKRDEEIAELRNSLTTKAALVKELGFRTTHLEQENEELRSSLKGLREVQINGVGAAASFKTLQQKFRALEQAHRGCSEKLKVKDAEWSTETEKLSSELDDCLLKLSNKDKQLQYLEDEVDVTHSSLMQQKMENEEISVVLLILESKFLESCSLLDHLKGQSEQYSVKTEERIRLLMEQLEKKSSDLARAQAEIKLERETVDSLLSKAEYSESVEQEYHLMKKEINSYKGLLEESSKILEQLKEQAARRESDLVEDIIKASVALDQANFALSEKSNQLSKVEFELEQSKLVVERMEKMRCSLEVELNKCHDESLLMRRGLEDSLLAKVKAEKDLEERKGSFFDTLKQKDMKIEDLQQHLVLLEEDKREFETKLESEKASEKKEKEKFLQFVEDMNRRLRSTQTEVDSLEQNYVLREIEILLKLEEEKMRFEQVIEEKEKTIGEMQQKILSHEQDFTRSVENAASIKQREAEIELCALNEALEKTMEGHILDKQEIYYRNILAAQLEEEIHVLQQHLVMLEVDKQKFEAKFESEKANEKEKEKFLQFVEDMDSRLKSTQTKVDSLEQNYVLREIEMLMKLEEERMRFQQVIEEREKTIAEMQQKILSYEQDFSRSVEFATSIRQRDAEIELCALNEAIEKTIAVHILDGQEIYYRNLLVAEMEEEIHALQRKVESGEKLSFGLKNCIQELEANLAAVLLEKEKEQVHFANELKSLLSTKSTLEVQAEEREYEKMALYGSIAQLSSDREELVSQMMGFGDLIGNISDKGEEVKRKCNRVMQIATDEDATATDFEVEDLLNSRKLDGRNLNSPSKNKAGQVPGRRSPLKENNC